MCGKCIAVAGYFPCIPREPDKPPPPPPAPESGPAFTRTAIRVERTQKIREYVRANPGATYARIVGVLDIPPAAVASILDGMTAGKVLRFEGRKPRRYYAA